MPARFWFQAATRAALLYVCDWQAAARAALRNSFFYSVLATSTSSKASMMSPGSMSLYDFMLKPHS